MSQASRQICLALLLGLLVGHASLVVHTATHTSADSAHCDLCNSYGNASETLPDIEVPELWQGGDVFAAVPDMGRTVESSLLSVRQRGPPVSD